MKTNATLIVSIIKVLNTLSNADLLKVLDIVNGLADIKANALVKESKPEKAPKSEKTAEFTATKLHLIKGVKPSVWSALNHSLESHNGKWIKGKKKGTGYWEFESSADCKIALDEQTEYSTAKGYEVALATLK